MRVDVTTETEISRSVEEVASYAMDPRNALTWYANIFRVELLTPAPVALGSRAMFHARLLGQDLEYTYEVVEFEPARVFTMITQQGPFPMSTTYRFAALDPGRTRMELRNYGQPTGFGALAAPMMVRAMRKTNLADLARLRQILETAAV